MPMREGPDSLNSNTSHTSENNTKTTPNQNIIPLTFPKISTKVRKTILYKHEVTKKQGLQQNSALPGTKSATKSSAFLLLMAVQNR
jgi:hypothetical protein